MSGALAMLGAIVAALVAGLLVGRRQSGGLAAPDADAKALAGTAAAQSDADKAREAAHVERIASDAAAQAREDIIAKADPVDEANVLLAQIRGKS